MADMAWNPATRLGLLFRKLGRIGLRATETGVLKKYTELVAVGVAVGRGSVSSR